MLDVRPFRAPNNATIFDAIRKNSTLDYQKRIPSAIKGDVQDTIHNLLKYRPQMNEFIDGLVNRIGLEVARGKIWSNPLSIYKIGMLDFGDTIEEYNIGLLKQKVYDADRDNLEREIFGQERPDIQSSFHKVNREGYYKLSVNEALLKRAFLNDNGLSTFLTKLMSVPTTSDNLDEFLLTTSLLKEYYDAGGFFNVNVPDISVASSTPDNARYVLRRLRELTEILQFPSTHYNASGMPVFASPDELVLLVTPEAKAAIDVDALAAAFNIDKADFASRMTVIPKENFAIPGAQAVLTTSDFFVIADQRIETTSVFNPLGLHTNYILHHWQVVSASRFVPAVLLTTEAGSVINIVDDTISDVTTPIIKDADGVTVTTVERGQLYQIDATAVTAGDNDAVRFELVGAMSLRTYIAQTGTLHIAEDEDATSLTINVIAVDNNTFVDSVTATVVGDKAELWPNPEVIPDADKDGLLEVTPEDLVMVDDTVTIPNVVGVQYKMDGVNVNNGSVNPIAGTVAFTAVARAGYELAAGATASWSFTV